MVTWNSSQHPLPGGREVEVLAADGEAVHEADAAAGGIAAGGERAGFEQGGGHESDLGDLAADAVDLNRVAHADAALAHQKEPAKEGRSRSPAGQW